MSLDRNKRFEVLEVSLKNFTMPLQKKYEFRIRIERNNYKYYLFSGRFRPGIPRVLHLADMGFRLM